ncbi:MAG: glycosyltransferase family 1 protein [Caldilineaceae bacterium]
MGISSMKVNLLRSKRPCRILHIVHRMRAGGLQTVVMNIYRHIDHSQVQFDFVVRTQQQDFYDQEIQKLGGRLFRLPWKAGNPLRMVEFTSALGKVLQDAGPFTAVHVHTGLYAGHYLPTVIRHGIKTRIVHAHSTSTELNKWFHQPWHYLMRKRIAATATHTFACSQPAGNWLFGTSWLRSPHAKIIRNAIDLSQYEILPADKKISRADLELPVDAILIGHIGRLDPVKNHHFLLDTFAIVHQQIANAHLVLVGEGQLRNSLEQHATALGIAGAVHFLGARADVHTILHALDGFVMPSSYEGLGLALIEAQAAGIPAIASDTIPNETDLGLGLVRYESLNTPQSEWANLIMRNLGTSIPTWPIRKAALQDAGYDIQQVSAQLSNFYLHNSDTKLWPSSQPQYPTEATMANQPKEGQSNGLR